MDSNVQKKILDFDCRLFKIYDLRVRPSKILLMGHVVRINILVINLENVVEPETNRHVTFPWDKRKEAAA